MDSAPTYNAERVTTGIDGLDEILGGGLPVGHLYLVEGESGAGKSTVGMQFLLAGQARGDRCLWITMSETAQELRNSARSHGWKLDGIEILTLFISQEVLKAEERYSFFSPADVELNDTTRAIIDAVKQIRPARVVFDPFTDIRHLARDTLSYRRQILALRDFFAEHGCTVLLMQEVTRGGPADIQAEALTHGYLTLHQESPEYGGQRRRLRVHKMRGMSFRDGYHDFTIRTGGIQVHPRLIAADHFEHVPDGVFSTGLPAMDALLGGGVDRGSSLLVMGPAGVGKSTLAGQLARTAAARGEKALVFMFDETTRAALSRYRRLNMDMEPYIRSGMLQLRHVDSAEFSPGEFAQMVMDAVERDGVSCIVVDSLSGYLNAMPEERFLAAHVHELLTYLTYRNVVTVLTLVQHGIVGDHVQSAVDLSYLADSVLLLRYFEARGAVRRALSVLKKRSGAHEVLLRELTIGLPDGITIGKPLVDFEGILSGRPSFKGAQTSLNSDGGPR